MKFTSKNCKKTKHQSIGILSVQKTIPGSETLHKTLLWPEEIVAHIVVDQQLFKGELSITRLSSTL